VHQRLGEQEVFTVDKIKSNLDRKQRRLLIEILELISAALSEVSCAKSKQCLDILKKAILAKYRMPEG
jgi:hypothetical protein